MRRVHSSRSRLRTFLGAEPSLTRGDIQEKLKEFLDKNDKGLSNIKKTERRIQAAKHPVSILFAEIRDPKVLMSWIGDLGDDGVFQRQFNVKSMYNQGKKDDIHLDS